MSLQEFKITSADIAAKGVVSAPDKLTGTPEANKAMFDKLVREAFAGLYNALIDMLEGLGVEQAVQYENGDGKIAYIRVNSDRVIETSTDGANWQATGSSGHVIVKPDGTVMPQRSRMRFTGDTVITDDGTQTIISGVRGSTGEQGPQGPQGVQGPQGPQGPRGYLWYPTLDSLGNLIFALTDTETPPPTYNIRGPQGPQGVQGPQGATGSRGAQGIQGPQGVQGPQGEQGETGPTGATGATGAAGPQGPQGPQGEQGATGPRGATGATGPQGPTGPQGATGPRGDDGRSLTILARYSTLAELQASHPTGAAGDAYAVGTVSSNYIYVWNVDTAAWDNIGALQGPEGPQGPTGATGPQGPTGATGAQGPRGLQGVQGPQGPKGDTGDTGANGAQGPQGIQGIQGEQGPRGPQGETGPQGPQGQAGEDAYTGAQAAGYTGTEEQFYSDLAGVGSKVPSTRKVNNKALSSDITLTASDVSAIPTSQKGAASGVASLGSDGKVPTSQLPSMSSTEVYSKTLTTAGWIMGTDGRYYQDVSVTGITTATKVIIVDVDLTTNDTDAKVEYLTAWQGPSVNEATQGDGKLTFYSYELPTVAIPIFVGVSG